MFEILKIAKIAKRLDCSDNFWKQIYDEYTKKVMELYEIENIDNPNICTIIINSKEYFENFKNRYNNKNHKGLRRDSPGMNFESYAEKISSIRQSDIARNKKGLLKKCFLYLNLTNKDSCLMFFIFLYSLDCDVKKNEIRKVM